VEWGDAAFVDANGCLSRMRGSVLGDNCRTGQRRNLHNIVCTVLASSSGDGTRRECVVGPEGVLTCGRDACGLAWGRLVLVPVPSAWVIPLLSMND
jgi:hypothetical protein